MKQCQHCRYVSSSPASLVVTEISNGLLHLLHFMLVMSPGSRRCFCIFANPDGQVSVSGFHLGFDESEKAGGKRARYELFFRDGFFWVVVGWAGESHGLVSWFGVRVIS